MSPNSYHAHNKTTGYGHVYQGRFKSFPVQDDDHFHTVCRYVERNALAAKLVQRAEDYRWGSLWNWCGGDSVIDLCSWPLKRLPRWIERVNEPITKKEIDAVQNCIKRGSPNGTEKWAKRTAKTQGLATTLRPRGRPKKMPHTANLAPNPFFSDREIRLDNGWAIKIGRGLDIFQGPESYFDIGVNDLTFRQCRETSVDIYRE